MNSEPVIGLTSTAAPSTPTQTPSLYPVLGPFWPDHYDELYNIPFEVIREDKVYKIGNIMTFDTETSNGLINPATGIAEPYEFKKDVKISEKYRFYDDHGKQSLLYAWQFAVLSNDVIRVFMGRDYEHFKLFMSTLSAAMKYSAAEGGALSDENPIFQEQFLDSTALTAKSYRYKAKIYIHNLGFEFQHLRNLYEADFRKRRRTFARTPRKPLKTSISIHGGTIEFTDTVVLVQKSLKQWCKDAKLPVQKLDEPQDYYLKIRTPLTPLTDEEISYSVNDVVSMVYGIEDYRKKYSMIWNIPMTQTGEIRRPLKETMLTQDPEWCMKMADAQAAYSFDFYRNYLLPAFAGGWTHANSTLANILLKDIICFDFASSYPSVMTSCTYPTGPAEPAPPETWNELFDQDPMSRPNYHFLIKFRADHIRNSTICTFWSSSKLTAKPANLRTDNGKIAECDDFEAVMTDVDFAIFRKAYHVTGFTPLSVYRFRASYLSKTLILEILNAYAKKTSYKDKPGEEGNYNSSKQFVNGIYGTSVTRDICDDVVFSADGWDKTTLDEASFYDKQKKQLKNGVFLSYQLGVWVTAWARYNLWNFILQFDRRVAYGDTDSLKGKFTPEDIAIIDAWNEDLKHRQEAIAAELGFNVKLYWPETVKHKVKPLGAFAREEDCIEFKTLGAKRYVYEAIDKDTGKPAITATIAGMPKKNATEKFKHVDEFSSDSEWTPEESGKLMIYYNDDQAPATWIDYNGVPYTPPAYVKYGACLIPTSFDMKITPEYMDYIKWSMTGDDAYAPENYTLTAECFR